MRLEDSFYLLVVDEVRAQPELLGELQAIGPTKRVVSVLGKMAPILGPVGQPDVLVNTAVVPKVQAALGVLPADLHEALADWQRSANKEQAYARNCRVALCHMLWRNHQRAENAIDCAKRAHDDWALAHYLHGLLAGLTGDAGKAHFEIYLAFHREPYPSAKARIERALDLVR